jgi:hypothetical protein
MIKSRWMRWMGHVEHIAKKRYVYKILVLELEGKRPLRRPRYREGELESVDWIHLARSRGLW